MKRTGNFSVRLLAVALFTIPLVVLAEVVQKHELRIAIDDGSADGQLFVNLDDAASGIDLGSLQVGESQSIVDESGRSVLITRTDDGFVLNVDGKTIEVPALGAFDHTIGHTIDVEFDDGLSGDGTAQGVFVASAIASPVAGLSGDTVTIISSNEIDAATQDAIRSLLASAGHSSEVVFIDAPRIHDVTNASGAEIRRHVVIREDVE